MWCQCQTKKKTICSIMSIFDQLFNRIWLKRVRTRFIIIIHSFRHLKSPVFVFMSCFKTLVITHSLHWLIYYLIISISFCCKIIYNWFYIFVFTTPQPTSTQYRVVSSRRDYTFKRVCDGQLPVADRWGLSPFFQITSNPYLKSVKLIYVEQISNKKAFIIRFLSSLNEKT